MAGKVVVNVAQLGDSSTATQNFSLQSNVDGTMKLARGNYGATTADILNIDASGSLGVSVTPSAWGGNYKALEILYGGIAATNAGSANTEVVHNAYYSGTNWIAKYTGGYGGRYASGDGGHAWYISNTTTTAGNPITFTQALTLNSNGVLALQGGNTSATGVGIAFPATQVASSDANTLDDYEEGTWTPSLGGTATYTIQQGTYTKIGNVVYVSGKITVNAIGTGSTTTISGLPFVANAVAAYNGRGSVGYYSSLATAVTRINCEVANNTSTMSFLTNTAAAVTANAADPIFNTGTRVDFSCQYIV